MSLKNIVFLFGAGVEGKNQFDLPSGMEFKKGTIVSKNISEFYKAINKGDSTINNRPLLHHNSTSILYQTLIENGCDWRKVFSKESMSEEDEKRFSEDFKKEYSETFFSIEEQKSIENYLKYKRNGNKDSEAKNAFRNLYKSLIYNPIKKNEFPEDNLEKERIQYIDEIFLQRVCFFSYVDSCFNYLRKPSEYKREVDNVLKLYFSSYKCMYDSLNEKMNKQDMKDLPTDRNALVDNIKFFQNKIIENKKDCKELYYNIIKKHKDKFNINVITTNYTEFAEKIIELDSSQIKYLHGKLDLFESLESKKIAPLSEFSEDEIIFPYILIQSGIKPIVSPFQIKTFSDACNYLKKADYLIILGYGLNSDDEHIVTMIRYFLDNNNDDNKKNNNNFKVYNFIFNYKNKYIDKKNNNIKNLFKDNYPIAYELENKYKGVFINCDCMELDEILNELNNI